MIVFQPQRKRLAFDVSQIEDNELRNVMERLATLQNTTNQMHNGLDNQVKVAEQEMQDMLNKMQTSNQKLDDVLNSIKEQVASLVDASVKYIQTTQGGIKENEKFRASFIYLLRDAIENLIQIVEGLNDKAEGLIVSQKPEEAPESFEVEQQNEDEGFATPEMTPEPSSLIKSSIQKMATNLKVAAIFDDILKTIDQVEPVIDSAKSIAIENKKIMGEIQEIMGTLSQENIPPLEETEAFSPDGIPENEVEEAMRFDFEEPTTETTEESSEEVTSEPTTETTEEDTEEVSEETPEEPTETTEEDEEPSGATTEETSAEAPTEEETEEEIVEEE